jgi:ABC transporter family protein
MDIELASLTKRYGGTLAVDRIDLKIRSGTYCCLLGPSGCGKTTTLRMIAGHELVSDGDIVIGHRTVGDLPPTKLQDRIVAVRADRTRLSRARSGPDGASPAQTVRHVIIPIILPSLVGVALFGFTLSWDEVARSSQAIGGLNTLPLELQGLTTTVTTPEIYALGTLTTGVSFAVILSALLLFYWLERRKARRGSDAGKGLV